MEQIDTSIAADKGAIELKYFDIDQQNACVQLSTQMTGEEYRSLIGGAQVDEIAEKERKRIGRALILCLDKSGSMSGTPYNALKEGSLLVAKSVFENREFEHFITVLYDNSARSLVAQDYDQYEKQMKASNAGGGTSFGACF